ncbi:hypothetical protein HN615_17775 [Candidatus Woesearchaeota archaeon]|jgi:hypothetical protein|nr:hypothetical protein [Candidatus Woesearchaeota archaeon]
MFLTENTAVRLVRTSTGKIFKIFITKQKEGYWVSTVLYAKESVVSTKSFLDKNRVESYRKLTEWFFEKVDNKANFDIL